MDSICFHAHLFYLCPTPVNPPPIPLSTSVSLFCVVVMGLDLPIGITGLTSECPLRIVTLSPDTVQQRLRAS